MSLNRRNVLKPLRRSAVAPKKSALKGAGRCCAGPGTDPQGQAITHSEIRAARLRRLR